MRSALPSGIEPALSITPSFRPDNCSKCAVFEILGSVSFVLMYIHASPSTNLGVFKIPVSVGMGIMMLYILELSMNPNANDFTIMLLMSVAIMMFCLLII